MQASCYYSNRQKFEFGDAVVPRSSPKITVMKQWALCRVEVRQIRNNETRKTIQKYVDRIGMPSRKEFLRTTRALR